MRLLLAVFVLELLGSQPAEGYALNGYKWPDGSQVVMHLGLSHSPSSFPDGTGSWDGSATDALSIWNQYVNKVQFVPASAITATPKDGANSAFFSNTVYGDAWGTGVLAITLYISTQGSTFTETDVIFNNKLKWSSYRGPLIGSGPTGTYDFHRVALHEFGHVLGLDHPDQHGQAVSAVMNSIIGNLDRLADDDIAGAQSLYGLRITSSTNPPSARSGDSLAYQITADNNPTSYTAIGLPPGLQLDTVTGLVSGRCSTSGVFLIDVSAQGPGGTATGTIRFVIDPLPITSPYPPQLPIGQSFSYQIAADNNPVSFSTTNLPAGLTLDSTTGVISGTPTVTGYFVVTVTATGANSQASGSIVIAILPPTITSSNPPQIEFGDGFSYQITSTHNPTGFGATGLPAGLQLNPATGVINGTPTVSGYFYVTITAQTLYGNAISSIQISVLAPRITSNLYFDINIGSSFDYQITASNHPSSFAATGLPAGLQLESSTGRIGGVPTLSGRFQVLLKSSGSSGDALATLVLNVVALEASTLPVAKLSIRVSGAMVADHFRPRLYIASDANVVVLDTATLTVIQTIPMPTIVSDLNISMDGNKLRLTRSTNVIGSIDLNTLTVLPDLSTNLPVRLVREGGDGKLYITSDYPAGVYQIDPNSGATLSQVKQGEGPYRTPILITPDGKDLFIAEVPPSPTISKFHLNPGAAPTLTQQITLPTSSYYAWGLAISPDGQRLARIPDSYMAGDYTRIFSAADLETTQGTLVSQGVAADTVFSADGSLAIQPVLGQSKVELFDSTTRKLLRTVTLPDHATFYRSNGMLNTVAVDKDDAYFFVAAISSTPFFSLTIYVYPVKPPAGSAPPPHSLLNVATRLRSQTGDDVLIGGFIVTGTDPKKVILRGTGPSLPVADKLADPLLELHAADGTVVATNDNWNAHRADVLATGIPPIDEHEAAIVATLQPGSYTAIVRGAANGTGVALVELYDLSPESNSHIANISTRGKVETGDNVMIGGFIIGGDQPTKVIVRAIGPSLGGNGVSSALSDTTLDLHDGNGALIASNDDWQTDQAQEIIDSTVPPTDRRESAIVRTLQPGGYTAIVRGKNNTTGVALVEVYNLDLN